MRRTLLALAALLLGTPSCSASSGASEAPTFTAAEVRPSIEGTWNGTFVQGGTPRALKLVLTYVASNVATKCSNRTLGGALDLACVDVSTVNLTANLTRDATTSAMSGSFLITELKYQNRGDLSLQGAPGGAATDRFNGRLDQGKVTGTLSLADGSNVDVTLTR
jgi:hypothetical protein